MKIGDYITVQEITNQSVCRWVVLSDLVYNEYGGITGGIIKVIAGTKKEAWEKEDELGLNDTDTYLVNGTWDDSVIVGGVFVE